MTKQLQNGSFRMAIMVGGFLLTIATIIYASGGITPAIEKNAEDITKNHEEGCRPSVIVRQDVATLKADSASTKATLKRIEGKLDSLLLGRDS